MVKKKTKTAVRAIFLYLLMTCGSWMFINCYSNSYNRLSEKKILPASLDMSGDKAAVTVLDRRLDIDLSVIGSDSSLYCGAYILSPDEVRLAGYLISLCV